MNIKKKVRKMKIIKKYKLYKHMPCYGTCFQCGFCNDFIDMIIDMEDKKGIKNGS